MRINWFQTALLAVLAILLIQCGTPIPGDSQLPGTDGIRELETQPVSGTQDPSNAINDTQMAPTVSHPVDSGLQSLIDLAKEDLAQRLSISATKISLQEVKEVVWPDASLGCPQPGMKYNQVPEDGALIILQVDGINYNYHSGSRRGLFLCEKVYKDPNPPPQLDILNLTPASTDKNSSPPTMPDNSIPPGEDQ